MGPASIHNGHWAAAETDKDGGRDMTTAPSASLQQEKRKRKQPRKKRGAMAMAMEAYSGGGGCGRFRRDLVCSLILGDVDLVRYDRSA
jgi:hypothetical protein